MTEPAPIPVLPTVTIPERLQAADPVRFSTDDFAGYVQREELFDRASLCIVEMTDGFLLQGHRDKAAISEAVGFGCANTLVALMPRAKAQAAIAKTSRAYLDRLDRKVARR